MAGQAITLKLDFLNPASDPIATVALRARIGSGTFSEIQSFDEQSAPTDTQISHEVNYVTPATPGSVTFENGNRFSERIPADKAKVGGGEVA